MSSPLNVQRTVRFFTNTRRIPVMIGKIGGARVWGGPYTVVQLLVGAVTLFLGYQLMPWWGPLVGTSPLVWMIALIVIAVGATIAAGKIPSTRRKVNNIAVDAVGAVASSSAGTYNNRSVTLPKPHRVAGTVLIAVDAPLPAPARSVAQSAEKVKPAQSPAARAMTATRRVALSPRRPRLAVKAAPVTVAAPVLYMTGMERLLAQARAGKGT